MGALGDYLRGRGVAPRGDRPRGNFALQLLDLAVPGNIYRYNEGTGWSRNDLIGAGVQLGTGLPVAGLLGRLLSGRGGSEDDPRGLRGFSGRIGEIPRLGRTLNTPDNFERDARRISDEAAMHESQRNNEEPPRQTAPVVSQGSSRGSRAGAMFHSRLDGFNARAQEFLDAMRRQEAL